MKKILFLALFAFALTTVTQAQITTVTQADAPGTTGGTGFLAEFTFYDGPLWLCADTREDQEIVAVYFPFTANNNPSIIPWGNGYKITGGFLYDDYWYDFYIYTDANRNITSYTIEEHYS